MLSLLLSGWNPNAYPSLRALPLKKVFTVAATNLVLCVAVFWLLLFPAIFQANQSLQDLARTTNITLDANMQVSSPTYLMHNPNIIFASSEQEANGVVVIRPEGITVRRFLLFGAKTYSWKPLGSLSTWPAESLLQPLLIFMLPSLLIWSAVAFFFIAGISILIYSVAAYFSAKARGLTISYNEIWKVSLYATIPAFMILAAMPILRIGLPIAIVLGLSCIVWLGYSLIGGALLTDKAAPKKERFR